MKLQALGYKSDLIFTDFDGLVEDRGNYLVVRTLSNPNFFWGNLLIFDRAPEASDFDKWIALFKKEFTDPKIYHVTLAWDQPEIGDVTQFIDNGFELQKQVVLATNKVHPPPHLNPRLEVRPLQSTQEWNRMVEIQTDSAHDHLPRHEWVAFYQSQKERYMKMQQAGRGEWFGGFLNGELVAGLGIFHKDGIGRFQIVSTAPSHRRQGICGTLVYKSAQLALDKMGLKQMVMCADQEYHAARIYESVGFQPRNFEYGISWWDRNHPI